MVNSQKLPGNQPVFSGKPPAIKKLTADLHYVQLHLYDFLGVSATLEEHEAHLGNIFQKLTMLFEKSI